MMLAEHEERFRWIAGEFLERPAGDYAELLRRGHVSSPEGVDPDEWREEIRRKAPSGQDPGDHESRRCWGVRDAQSQDSWRSGDGGHEARVWERTALLGELARRNAELGHQLSGWLGHDDESIAFCERCGARI
jgi:hypothetical protein